MRRTGDPNDTVIGRTSNNGTGSSPFSRKTLACWELSVVSVSSLCEGCRESDGELVWLERLPRLA